MSNFQHKLIIVWLFLGLGAIFSFTQPPISGAMYEEIETAALHFTNIDFTDLESARTIGFYESEIIEAPIPFNALVPKWIADSTFSLEIRSRQVSGEWSDWYTLHENHDMTQAGDDYTTGDMLFVPAVDITHEQFQFRASTALFKIPELHFTFIDSSRGPSTEELIARQKELDAQNGSAADPNSHPKPFVVSRSVWCTSSLCNCPAGSCGNSCVDGDPLEYKSVNHLVVHHTVSNNNSADWAAVVRAIWQYHAFSQCWGDIGYNYLIDMNGTIYEGHRGGDNVVGTHAAGANQYSMGVSLIGTFTEPTHSIPGIKPPPAMQNALVELLAWKTHQRNIDIYDATYHPILGRGLPNLLGHRDVYGTTTCPGEQAHDLLPEIRDRVAQRLGFTPPHIYIDELSSNFSRSSSNWYTDDYHCGFNTHAWYTWSTSNPSQATNWGEWRLTVPTVGSYELSVYTPYCNIGAAETTRAVYSIYHKNGVSQATVNQLERLGLWTSLGTFELSPNSDHRIRLTDLTNDDGRAVWFDAVRIRYLGPVATNQAPAANVWLNSRSVNFSWTTSNSGSVSSSQLRVATDSNFNNIIHTAELAGNATSYNYTFGQDYDYLHWQILLRAPNGTVYSPATAFRLDSTPPTSRVNSITRTNDGTGYILGWSGTDGLSGLATYTIEYRIVGTSTWYTLLSNTTDTGTVVVPQNITTAYEFRSQAKDVAGNSEPAHNTADISTHAIPSDVRLKSPINGQWVRSENVAFEWELSNGPVPGGLLLQVASENSFSNLIVNQTVAGSAVSHMSLINGQYEKLYWRVLPEAAQGAPASVGEFRIDATAPTSTAHKVLRLPDGHLFVAWSGNDNQSGIDYYNLYYRSSPTGGWILWRSQTRETLALFQSGYLGQSYWFRSQATDIAGNVEALGSEANISTSDIINLNRTIYMPISAR